VKLSISLTTFVQTVCLSVLAGGIACGIVQYNKLYQPYEDVHIVAVVDTEEGILIGAKYVEKDCHLRELRVYGETAGAQTLLKYTNLDGRGHKVVDQPAGQRHLIIRILEETRNLDFIEIRTDHACDNKTAIGYVFARIKIAHQSFRAVNAKEKFILPYKDR